MGNKVNRQNQEVRRASKALRRWEGRKRLSADRKAAILRHIEAVKAGKAPPLNTDKAARREAQQRREAAKAEALAAKEAVKARESLERARAYQGAAV